MKLSETGKPEWNKNKKEPIETPAIKQPSPPAKQTPRASGRLRCVRVLSYPDRRNVLGPGYLDGGDAVTCHGLLKVNAESIRVLPDPDRRNVLDLGNLNGGDAPTCPGILCLGSGPLHLGLNCYGLSFAPHSLMQVYPDGGVE
ncbi:hypothetical protein AgCh_037716 [Apium graveolens]